MDRHERAGAAFTRLCAIMARLRAPGGCPWDKAQTLDSLKPYLIEEAYETLEALEEGVAAKHCEELGDLLLQIVFQAEICNETGRFDAAAVAGGIATKLERRHPHVFGEVQVQGAAGALLSWETVKATERAAGESRLHGVPKTMPALLRAYRTGEKAAAIGFDWPDSHAVALKVEEEWKELNEVVDSDAADKQARSAEELGDLLFALSSYARHLGVDPEAALRAATDKFAGRFRYVETRLKETGHVKGKVAPELLDALWNEAKKA
ncbi:MAG: nucleoside triphosphate pyrophosphohydrolase [Deltaproteobacteria bacterium]|nr:nucleoside triphosphate pyrophosphohydrolase [Deltaproteobacteria bacterium]